MWGYKIKSNHVPLVGDSVSLVVKNLQRGVFEWVSAEVFTREWRFDGLGQEDEIYCTVKITSSRPFEMRAHSTLLSSDDEEVVERLFENQIAHRKKLRSQQK
jgi:hypothetical protein